MWERDVTRLGDPWLDNAWPVIIGLLAALAHIAGGGGALALVTGPALAWAIWQAARWASR